MVSPQKAQGPRMKQYIYPAPGVFGMKHQLKA